MSCPQMTSICTLDAACCTGHQQNAPHWNSFTAAMAQAKPILFEPIKCTKQISPLLLHLPKRSLLLLIASIRLTRPMAFSGGIGLVSSRYSMMRSSNFTNFICTFSLNCAISSALQCDIIIRFPSRYGRAQGNQNNSNR